MQRLSRKLFGPFYVWLNSGADRHNVRQYRAALFDTVGGVVVEIGAGNGLNFQYLSPSVSFLVAVEPSSYLQRLAKREAKRHACPIGVVSGVGEALPVRSGSVDVVVLASVLCRATNPHQFLWEVSRILKPGGELRVWEHVRSDRRYIGRMQAFAAPLWLRASGGCHIDRDSRSMIEEAGFKFVQLRRSHIDLALVHLLVSSRILGVAVKV